MNRRLLIALALTLIAGMLLGLLLSNGIYSTGNVIQEGFYSYTTAVCTPENECLDIVIGCENGRVISLEPLLFVVRHPSNWTDIRGNVSSFC